MEPSFIATPYVQASTPSSAELRAMLDQQEAQYLEWRQTRKPVHHAFASRKLNSSIALAPVGTRSPSSPVEEIRQKFALGSTKMTELPLFGHGKRKGAIQLGLGAHGLLPSSSRKELPRLSSLGNTDLSIHSRKSLRGVVFDPTVTERPKPISEGVRVAEVELKPASGDRQEGIAGPRSIRVPRASFKYLKPYLYDYYTRQVFSCAAQNEDDHDVSNTTAIGGEDSNEGEDNGQQNSDTDSYTSEEESSSPFSATEDSCNLVVPGLALLSPEVYHEIFQFDWSMSGVEKSVRDAVDRRRIAEILRSGYRVLLWFFRYYAGNAAINSGATVKGAGSVVDRLGGALGNRLFEIPSGLRLLEDLNIQCVEATAFGITDAPLKREYIIDFLLGVARMNCAHTANPARQRVLANDGVELSESVRALVHDHFAAFSQIQDANHFRVVFLTKPTKSCKANADIEALLEHHAISIANFFEELTRPAAGFASSNNATSNTNNTNGGNALAGSRQRNEKAYQINSGVSCSQFVQILHALKLIANKGGETIPNLNSEVVGVSTNSQTLNVDSPPTGIEEVRAVRIFLSCLPMVPPSAITDTTPPPSQPQELQLPQFTEALLRVSLAWREREICRGRYDVCPGQLSSSVCECRSELMDYSFDEFRGAVDQVLTRIHSHRLSRVQKRASIKMASIRSVRRPRARLSHGSISAVDGVPE